MEATSCLLCRSAKQTVLRDTLRYGIKRKVLRCKDCGHGFLEAQNYSADFYSSKDYRANYGPDLKKASNSEEIFNTYFPHQGPIVEEIKHLFSPTMSVLDVGCSTGQFLAAIKGLVGTRVGLELSLDAAEFIRTRLDFPVYSELIETVAIKEGPFDMVTALQVVEHVPDPINFIKNLGCQLKPGGYLYLELPNLDDSLISCYKISGYADFYFREPHVSYFTRDTLLKATEAAGFSGSIKTVQRYNLMNHLHWILTGKPQENFTLGNGTPKIVADEKVNPAIATELNNFIAEADKNYKKIIEKHGLGECLTFLGQLKK